MKATEIKKAQRRLLIDLDNVLYDYDERKDADGVPVLDNDPMPGAVEAVHRLVRAGYTYVVWTTRMYMTKDKVKQEADIHHWLIEHGFPKPEAVTCEKWPCLAMIDDRAHRFTNWEDIRKLWS